MAISIAIDGPAGAGKSTIADGVASALGILHLDTGALYRALGLRALRLGLDPKDPAQAAEALRDAQVSVRFSAGKQVTLLGGEDVSGAIRAPEISAAASAISQHAPVRAYLVDLQQQLAASCDMVLDGRDIGTRVLPHATVKIYLTAADEERARRRYEEDLSKGLSVTYEAVLSEMRARDAQDMNRQVDPLRPAEDAVLVDSTTLSQEQVVEAVLSLVRPVLSGETL